MKLKNLLEILPEENINLHLIDADYDHAVATIVNNPMLTTEPYDKHLMSKYSELLECEVEKIEDSWLGLAYLVRGARYGRVENFQFELAGYGHDQEEYEDDEE